MLKACAFKGAGVSASPLFGSFCVSESFAASSPCLRAGGAGRAPLSRRGDLGSRLPISCSVFPSRALAEDFLFVPAARGGERSDQLFVTNLALAGWGPLPTARKYSQVLSEYVPVLDDKLMFIYFCRI